MRKLPDFCTYFGPQREGGFMPLEFWVFPVMTPVYFHNFLTNIFMHPMGRA